MSGTDVCAAPFRVCGTVPRVSDDVSTRKGAPLLPPLPPGARDPFELYPSDGSVPKAPWRSRHGFNDSQQTRARFQTATATPAASGVLLDDGTVYRPRRSPVYIPELPPAKKRRRWSGQGAMRALGPLLRSRWAPVAAVLLLFGLPVLVSPSPHATPDALPLHDVDVPASTSLWANPCTAFEPPPSLTRTEGVVVVGADGMPACVLVDPAAHPADPSQVTVAVAPAGRTPVPGVSEMVEAADGTVVEVSASGAFADVREDVVAAVRAAT